MLDNGQTVVELSLFEQNCQGTILPLFSIYSNGIKNIYPTGNINLRDLAYEVCKEKKLQDSTQKLRNLRDEKERDEFKKTLSYVTFSGIFRKRSKEGLINHSGYICIDIDHVGDNTKLETIKKQILQKFTLGMMFISPSGDGLKIVFKMDLSQGTHLEYFSALSNYFKSLVSG